MIENRLSVSFAAKTGKYGSGFCINLHRQRILFYAEWILLLEWLRVSVWPFAGDRVYYILKKPGAMYL